MKDAAETKTEYRHKQAAACHSAAASSSSSEVKRAFLELEQGWLQLMGTISEEPRQAKTKRATRSPEKRMSQR